MKNKNKQGASTGDVLKREFPSGNSISSESSKKKSKLNNDTPSLTTRATTKTAKVQESEDDDELITVQFWNTVVVFINNGSVVEDQTSRWQSFLENMHLIGTAQRKKTGAVNGQIPLSALKSLQNASKALPYQKAEKEKKPPKSKPIISESEDEDEEDEDNNDNADNHNSEDEKTPSKSTRHSRRSQSPATPPQTPPEQGIKSKTKGSRVLSPREGAWRSTWISIMQPHSTAGWAAGFTNVLTRTFTHESVNDIVKFLDELYRTKNSVAINNGSKSVQALENSKDQARQVKQSLMKLKKFLLTNLAVLLDQKQLGAFARLYLRNRGKEKCLRKTIDTRTKFLARHFLEVLGFGKDGGHTKNRFAGKTRMVKAQRMTAKAVNLLADVFGSGSLLLMWRSV
ncbi:hypothetical protein KCU77_g11670, partial [Aureobasidium melanogenum]